MNYPNERSITHIREHLYSIIKREKLSGLNRSIFYFAIDGIKSSLTDRMWKNCFSLDNLKTVFPTTSSTCWCSAFTGQSVTEHGIVGTVFRVNDSPELINIYTHPVEILLNTNGNIFSDARTLGYTPIAMESDLTNLACGWKNTILKYSISCNKGSYFTLTTASKPTVKSIVHRLIQDINSLIDEYGSHSVLFWIFLDVDYWIHATGYSSEVAYFLEAVDQIGTMLSDRKMITLAHSDHGLVETVNDLHIKHIIDSALIKFNAMLGGAGRTRWFYSSYDEREIISFLEADAGGELIIKSTQDVFPDICTTVRSRLGKAVIMPRNNRFIVPSSYAYEHGSYSEDEIYIPMGHWQ